MKRRKRKHEAGFKSKLALEALRGRYTPGELAAAFDVNASLVHAWRSRLQASIKDLFAADADETDREAREEARHIEKRIAELKAEQEWMRRAIRALSLRERRELVDMDDRELSVLRQTNLLGLHRSGVYYKSRKHDGAQDAPPEATDGAGDGENLPDGNVPLHSI